MLFGLASALGFGIADLFGATSVKKIGVLTTLLIIQTVNVVVLSLLLLTPFVGSLSTSWGVRAAILVAGLLGTVSYFSFLRALQLGPVSIVTPVFASYAALTVVLSVVFDGERFSGLTATGIGATIVGVVLASARRSDQPRTRASWGGIPFAAVAAVAWGVASYLIGHSAQQVGWFLPQYGVRLVEFLGVIVALAVVSSRGGRLHAVTRGSLVIASSSAIADNIGIAAFSRGSQLGLVSITSAVSASFPLVVIAGTLVLFGERPSARQWVGIAAAITGLVLLGLSQ
jgi:drug/metabolite transporter (DMT)-like permease